MGGDAELAAAILQLVAARGPGRTICPSEVARACAGKGGDWRALMPQVRAVAMRLEQEGRLTVTQRGRRVDPATIRGPVRLGVPQRAIATSPSRDEPP